MDDISIIIRNKNEGEFIGFAIQSCLDFFDKPEIIIVDNESTDDSLEVIHLFQDRADIYLANISNFNYTPGAAINLGVRQSTGKYVLILSAHSQITSVPDDLYELLDKYAAVMGRQVPIYRGKRITPRYIWSHFGEEPCENMWSDIEQRYFLHNAFCFYKKETLLNFPMPERYPGKEDRYWAADIVGKLCIYYYCPRLICNHFYTSGGATWKGIG